MGNTRLSYFKNANGSAEVLEENNYYPFGLKHEGYNALAGNSSYQYKYNSKELQEEMGMYDYGARFYMPDLGRWGVIDPLAEVSRRFTPYHYGNNNPIRFIDPDGRSVRDVNGDGTYMIYDGDHAAGALSFLQGMSSGNRNSRFSLFTSSYMDASGTLGSGGGSSLSPWMKANIGGENSQVPYLINNSSYTIYFKPETFMKINGFEYLEDGSYPLAPGKSWYYPIDGVAAPHINKEQVFKLSDGMSLEITNKSYNWTYTNGSFLKSIGSYTSMFGGDSLGFDHILTKDTGGWKNQNWLHQMSANTTTKIHNSWNSDPIISTKNKVAEFNWINLFMSSGLTNANNYKQPHTHNIISYGR